MTSGDQGGRNRLLAALPRADRDRLRRSAERVGLDARQVLETPGVPIRHVYFLDGGLVSVVGAAAPGHRIEVGMVGCEGMTGLAVVLGGDRSANLTLVQAPGVGLRIAADSLRQAMAASRAVTAVLLRYVHVFMMQGSQTALANGLGRVGERLARWLLMWHDRVGADELVITHDFVALLLGVRRPGVTVALHELEGLGLIRSTRNRIRIVDRRGLRRAAGGFYGIPEAEYDRLIGLAPGRRRSGR